MSTGRWNNAHSFRVSCDCHTPDHDVNAWIEVAQDEPHITVTFYAELWTPVSSWWQRVKIAWNVMVHGVHRQEHDLMLREQAARNFAAALTQSVEELGGSRDSRGD